MGIGLGIFLIVLGAIFLTVLEVDIGGIDQYALGWILVGAGILSIVLGFLWTAQARRTRTTAGPVVEERREY